MIEVFKTGVCSNSVAGQLVKAIQRHFPKYTANFDLEDCDHILRVSASVGAVNTGAVVALLHSWGYEAEPLEDEIPADAEAHSRNCDAHVPWPAKGAAPDFYRNICLHLRRMSNN